MSRTVKPASKFATSFVELVSDPDVPEITVLIGGGSIIDALQPAFLQMAELDRSWENLTLSFIDERYSFDLHYPDSNFMKLTSTDSVFQLQNQGMEIAPILVADASLEAAGKHFADYLSQILAEPQPTKVVGIVGVGADYHLAGIVPHRQEYEYMFHENLAVGYKVDDISDSPNPYRDRITITFTGLQKLHECWLYATGEDKRPVIETITAAKQPTPIYNEKPAVFLWELPELKVFTDQL